MRIKKPKNKIIIKVFFTLFLVLIIIVSLFGPLDFLKLNKGSIKDVIESLETKYANAHYQYSPSSQTIIYGRSKTNDFRSLGTSDGARWEIGTVAQGLDAVLSFKAINPRSANKIIISYRGYTSTTTLNYQIQICDYVNTPGDYGGTACGDGVGIWRNITDHGSSASSSSLSYNADRSYAFHLFNGYFSGETGNITKNTPISDFINNGELKLRFYSTTSVTDLMLYLDYLQVEVVIDNFYQSGGIDVGNESVSAGQYTDTYVQDVARAGTCSGTQCLQITNSGDGLSATFKFKNIAAPYQGANTILIYEFGYVTANNYYIDLCSSFDSTPSCLSWDTLNSSPYANTNATYHTVARTGINPSNYINNLNEMWVRIRVNSGTGNYRMDYISATIGSTNISSSQSEISLGTNGANDSSFTGTLDNSTTSTSTTMWQVNSAIASAAALQSTMYSDDAIGVATNEYGVSANVSVPITAPDNSLVTEIIWAARWSMVGGTTITTAASLRTYSRQWRQQIAEAIAVDNNQTFQMGVYGACTPCTEAATAEGVTSIAYGPIPRDHSGTADTAAAGWMEGPAVAIAPAGTSGNETAVSAWESIDSVTNMANIRIRTTDSTRTTAGINLFWDFAFVSIRYIDGIYPTAKARVTAQNGGLTSGASVNSNWRFTLDSVAAAVAAPSWNISDGGGTADAWLEFSTTTLPSSANKLILTNRIAASADASNTILMICDFATSTGVYGTTTECNSPGGWRVLNHVAQGYPYDYSAANTFNIFQFEVYNGYFGTSTMSYDTPLSNFFNNGAARIRLLENNTANITFYWKFSQLEIATDNFYSPAGYQAFTEATTTGSYIDTYLPDTCTPPYSCFSSESSSNNVNFYLKFKNIATPYPNANSIYIDTTMRAINGTTTPFSVRICNFSKAGGNCTADTGWENLNSQQLYPSSVLTRYQFIKKVNKWSDYINSSNEIWIGYYGAHTEKFYFNLDYSQIAVGSVTEDISSSDVSYGTSYLGNALLTANADNSVLVWDQKNCWLVNSYSPSIRSGDLLASVSAGVKVSASLPERALPTAIRWAAQSWQGGAFTVQARFKNFSGDYDIATNAGKLMTTLAGTTGYDAITRADASFAMTDLPLRGVYITNPEDYIDTVNNQIGYRWVTSAAVLTGEQQLYWDYLFVTLRYLVPDDSLNNSYRWYANKNDITPDAALESENQAISNSSPSSIYRLRVNLLTSVTPIATSTRIKLQYSENLTSAWYDVGAAGSSAVWRFYDNDSIAGGTILPSALLADSDLTESYEETNPSTSTPGAINSYKKGEFDFSIQNNNAKAGTSYFFRIVRYDGFIYDAFNNYPRIITANAFSVGDGLLVYGSSAGGGTSQFRTWSKKNWTWSDEGDTQPASTTIRWNRTKASPVKNEFIVAQGSQGTDYTSLDVMRYNGASWQKDWTATTSSATLGDIRFFDVAYEGVSGNAMVVYSDNTSTPKYRKYTAISQSWGDEQSISVSQTSGTILLVVLVAKSGENEIAFAYYDSASDLNVLVWDGSSWGSEPASVLENSVARINFQSFDLDYESASGDLDLFWGKSGVAGVYVAEKLSGQTTWTTSTSNITGDPYNLDIPDLLFVASDPSTNSNYIAIAIKSSSSDDLDAAIWNGSNFIAKTPNIDSSCEAEIAGARMTDVGWADGTAFLVYADSNVAARGLQWARWAPGSSIWILQTAVLGGMGDLRSVKIYNSPDNTYAMVIHSRDTNNANTNHSLWAHVYDGINWRGVLMPDLPLEPQLSTAASAPYSPFGFAFARHTPTLAQNNYQWFSNADSVQPGASLADKNSSTTSVYSGTVLRLRIEVGAGVSDLAAFSQNFKLQYKALGSGCSSNESWADVGAIGSASVWRGYNNSSRLDGDLISSAILTSGNSLQTYEEQNPTAVNTNHISASSSGEWDFAIENNSAPENTTYCFRLAKANGLLLTSYNYYPVLSTALSAHLPIVSQVSLNSGNNIDLIENSTTSIIVVATATDSQGYSDIQSATGKIYRSNVTGGENCSLDDNNCYQDASCSLGSCASNSCKITCSFTVWFHADPTDAISSWPSESWIAWVKATDLANSTSSATNSSETVDVYSLRAISVDETIPYGLVGAGSDTGGYNPMTTITNTGNSAIDIELSGSNMCIDFPACLSSFIGPTNQQFSTNTFSFGEGSTLSNSTSTVNVNLPKPTSHSSDSTDNIYWSLRVPTGTTVGIYTGENSFTATGEY